jgi:hypothetical protein
LGFHGVKPGRHGMGVWMSAPEVARRSIAITGSRCGFRSGQAVQDGPEARDRWAASSAPPP